MKKPPPRAGTRRASASLRYRHDPWLADKLALLVKRWAQQPVALVTEVLAAAPDPWQCDVLDAVTEFDNVAVRACHGVGKTALLAWVVIWFTVTRPSAKVPTTAPTFNKQVRDVLWAEIHKWWRSGRQPGDPAARWLLGGFDLTQTRLQAREAPTEWFAAGIASSQPLNIEGYHSEHLLAVFDEAKGIGPAIWDAVQGMRTTQEAKMLVASTPGGPHGEFFKVFTKHRTTWKSLFVIHPEPLRATLARPEAADHSRGGTYYSKRVRPQWVEDRRQEWGEDNPAYVARVIGDFPTAADDLLIPYAWLSDAEEREDGYPGDLTVVACDAARYGRDRTVILAGRGGVIEYAELIARTPAESLSPTATAENIGPNPRQPRYRAVDATVDACRRVRQKVGANVIVIDDTGLGSGVTDLLRRKGERVVPINFGAAPTDRPKTAEQRASRERKHLVPSRYVNLKAQMGWALREAFETGQIALQRLPRAIRDTLITQASMVKYELDAAGRLRLIDPDDQDDLAQAAAALEGRRSPDHLHALLLFWWIAGNVGRAIRPQAGALPNISPGIQIVGRPRGAVGSAVGGAIGGGLLAHLGSGRVGSQVAWIERAYGPY